MKTFRQYLPLLAVFGMFLVSAFAADRDFALRTVNVTGLDGTHYTKSSFDIYGNYQLIGNTVLSKGGGASTAESSVSNSNEDLKWVDIDGVNNTFNNSSSSQFKLLSGEKILWAGLYWQSILFKEDNNKEVRVDGGNVQKEVSGSWIDSNKVKLTVNTTTPQTITSTQYDYVDIPTDFGPNTGYAYGAFADITTQLKTLGSGIHTITVGNIASQRGQDSITTNGVGNFGAWSLVIVYETDTTTMSDTDKLPLLKNVTINDGYKIIISPDPNNGVSFSKDIPISGFVTPCTTSGITNSAYLSAFSGEGDKYLPSSSSSKYDTMFVRNNATPTKQFIQVGQTTNTSAINYKNNLFDSSITFNPGVTGVTRTPFLTNNNGIDIDTFDVSNIIANGQQDTVIRLSTKQDTYFPSLVVFAAAMQKAVIGNSKFAVWNITQDNNAIAPNKPAPKDQLQYSMTFKNTGNSPASKVTITDMLPNTLDYNKTIKCEIKPVSGPTTSCLGGNPTYNPIDGNLTYTILNIGMNSDVNITFDTDVRSTLRGNESQSTNGLTIQNEAIGVAVSSALACIAGGETPTEVTFTAPETGAITAALPPKIDAWEVTIIGAPPAVGNRKIYTKIANDGAATLRVGSLDTLGSAYSDYTSGLIGWRIVPTTSCPAGDNNITGWADLNLTNTSPYTNPQDISFVIPKAGRSYSVQFTNKESTYSEANKHCSSDHFSVRPDRLDISIASGSPKLLKAGEDYALIMTARDVLGATTTDYNQNTANLTYVSPPTKYNPNDTPNPGLYGVVTQGAINYTFVNGTTSQAQFTFSDVGKIKLDVNDTEWSSVDASDGTPIANRTIHGEGNFTFIPYRFALSNIQIIDSRGGNFTYLSNDLNMSAKFDFNITAQNKQGVTTRNFASGLYEEAISVIPSVINTVPLLNSNESNISALSIGFTDGTSHLTWNDTNTSKVLKFNFSRNSNPATAINPFDINLTEANISVSALYNDSGFSATIENNTTNKAGVTNGTTGNAIFIYGRADAPDYRFSNNPGCGKVFYEFYDTNVSDTVATSIFGNLATIRSESPDANWYKNTLHDVTLGDGNITGISVAHISANNTNGCLAAAPGGGFEKRGFLYDGSQGYPYRGTAQLDASDWLDVTGNNFGVEFYKSSGWIGETTKSKTATDSDVENISNRRIMW